MPAFAFRLWPLAGLLALAGCGSTSGIFPVGPDVYTVSEMRAPVLGGAAEAQRVAVAEASSFCQQQGRIFQPLEMRPDGDPRSAYYPTAFDVTFHCAAPGAAVAGGPAMYSSPQPQGVRP